MRPERLLRLYPRAWRERYGEEILILIGTTAMDWRTAMDIGSAAFQEWLDHPNMRGSRELGRLIGGFAGGIALVLGVVAVTQAAFMASMHMSDISVEVLATSRGLSGPLTKLWALATALSTAVALAVVGLGLDRSKPRRAAALVKYLWLIVVVVVLTVTAPPFARISLYSRAMAIELAMNVYLAGLVVNWAILGPRRQKRLAATA